MRITISVPCFGRPQRTRRIIDAICQQDINGWEALIIGDGCPDMQKLIDSEEYRLVQEYTTMEGNSLIIENNKDNMGGCGYAITNANIQRAKGKYFCFAANDDVIERNHFRNYLSLVEADPDLDMAFYPSWVTGWGRTPILQYGHVGHSEMIVRTELAKKMPPHSPEYGHDWEFIRNCIEAGASHKIGHNHPQTYKVMSLPNRREEGID